MNVIEFKSLGGPLVFCLIDNTFQYSSAWTRELIKNQSDYIISNLVSKGYDVYQSVSEDAALKHVTDLGYSHAVVFSTGTEFINGRSFFSAVEQLMTVDFLVAGHILDRGDAYYELHHQCFVVNLLNYKKLWYPKIGKQELGSSHTQIKPNRNSVNVHDDYTPVSVSTGNTEQKYNHKLHGWHILKSAFEAYMPVIVFDDSIRHNKKHYYPEHQQEFLKHIDWAYLRMSYCENDFVHTGHTEDKKTYDTEFEQVITPASGLWFTDYISKTKPVRVVFYDYNQRALDYWKERCPIISNVEYKFVKCNLLGEFDINELVDSSIPNTVFNASNIFCYEGTSMFYSLEYRLHKENELLRKLPKDTFTIFSERSCNGFIYSPKFGKNLPQIDISELQKPTWHINGDWY